MIKVQNGVATREPIPSVLAGLAPESLSDLTWTDATLGLRDVAWWPEVAANQPFDPATQYLSDAEVLTVDSKARTVLVSRLVLPIPASDLAARRAEAIARQWEAIKAERERRRVGGLHLGMDWFHSDDVSRIQQLALSVMGQNIPYGLQWKTMSGSFVTMTPALAGQIFTGQVLRDQAIFACAEKHRINMAAAPDPLAYDIHTDWPEVYGG
jgi:hypothetical protein